MYWIIRKPKITVIWNICKWYLYNTHRMHEFSARRAVSISFGMLFDYSSTSRRSCGVLRVCNTHTHTSMRIAYMYAVAASLAATNAFNISENYMRIARTNINLRKKNAKTKKDSARRRIRSTKSNGRKKIRQTRREFVAPTQVNMRIHVHVCMFTIYNML